MVKRHLVEMDIMSYRCDRCGEAIDEHQFYSFGQLCPACVRATMGDDGGKVQEKSGSGFVEFGQKMKGWFAADRDRALYVGVAAAFIVLALLWVGVPALASVWGVCISVLGLYCFCKFQRIKERPQLVKKER